MTIPVCYRATPKILLTRGDRMGDVVLTTPVLKELRTKFQNSHIALIVQKENLDLVQGNPFIDEVIVYDKKGKEKSIWGSIAFAWRLSEKKFDMVVHFHPMIRMHFVSWFAGISTRLGYDRKGSWMLTHTETDSKHEGKMHEAQYNFRLLAYLGIKLPEKLETHVPLQKKASADFKNYIKSQKIDTEKAWVVINPSASCPSKRWPAAYFGELIQKMSQEYDVDFLLVGTNEDRDIIERVKDACGEVPVYDTSGKLSVGMLAQLLSMSSLLISNDSGPVHVASALGTPVISIFGRNQPGLSPKRWGPLGEISKVVWKDVGCEECLAHKCEIEFQCLTEISVDELMTEVKEFSSYLKYSKVLI